MDIKGSLKEIGKHGSVYVLGWVLNSVLSLALLPVYTRYLAKSEYGMLSLLDSTIEMVRILCALGIGSAIVRFFHDKQDDEHRRKVMSTGITFLMIMIVVIGIIVYPLSGKITSLVLGESGRPLYFQLALVTMLLGLLRSGADNYLTTSKRSTTFIIVNSGQTLLSAAINLYLIVVLDMGVLGMLTGSLISSLLVNIVLLQYVIRKNGLGIDKPILMNMFRFGLPLVPAILAAAAMHNMDRFFIRSYVSIAEVGLYSIAYMFPFMLNGLFANAFSRIWGASTMYSIARQPDATYQFSRICTYYMTVLTFALFAISVGADTLISVFAAPSYFDAQRYLPIIALGVWGYALHTFVRIGVDLTKRTYLFTINYILAFVINLVLNFIIVPRWGAMGAAWVTVLTYFSFSIGGFLIYRHCYPIRLEWIRLVVLIALAYGLFTCRQFITTSGFTGTLLIELSFIALFPLLLIFSKGFFTAGEKLQIKTWCYSKISRSKKTRTLHQ